MATFNPYTEAANDYAAQRNANRKLWRGWCCKCNVEKPLKGGTYPGMKKAPVMRQTGVVRRFVCAECLAVKCNVPSVSG